MNAFMKTLNTLLLLPFLLILLIFFKKISLGSKWLKRIDWLLEFLLIGENQQDKVKISDGKTINLIKPEYRRFLLSYPLFTVAIFIMPYALLNMSNVVNLNKVLLIIVISQVFALGAVHYLIKMNFKGFLCSIIGGILFAVVVCFLCANYIGYPVTKIISSSLIGDYKIIQVIQILSTMVLGLLIFIMLIPFLYALYNYFDQTKIRCTTFIKNLEKIVLIIFNIVLLVITIAYIISKISKSTANTKIFLISIIIAVIFTIPLVHFILLIRNLLITIFISVFYSIVIFGVGDFLISQSSGACMIKFVYKIFFESFKLFNQLFVYLLFSGIVAFAVGSLNFFNPAKNRNKSGINKNRDRNNINIVPIMFKSFPVLGILYLVFILYLLPFIGKVNGFSYPMQLLIAYLFILILLVFAIEVSVFVIGFVRFLYSSFYKILDTVKYKPFNYDTLDSWRWMVNFIKNEEIESKSESYFKSILDTFYGNFDLVKTDFRCKDTVVSLTKIYEEFNDVLRDKNKGKKFAKIAYRVLFKDKNDNRLTKYFCGLIGSKANASNSNGENKIVFENQPFFEWIFYPRNYEDEDFEYVYDFVCSFVEFFCLVYSECGPDCKNCLCNDLKKAYNVLIKNCVSSGKVENKSTKSGDCKKNIVELLNKLIERYDKCLKALKKIEEIKKLIDADVEKGYEKFNEEFEKLTDGCDEFRNYEKFSELFEQLENIKNILKENSKGAKGRLDKEIETIKKILNSKEYKDVKSKIENCKKFFEECRKS